MISEKHLPEIPPHKWPNEKPAPIWEPSHDFQPIIEALEILEIRSQVIGERLGLCRDSLCQLDRSDGLPEGDKGIYWQALQILKSEFPHFYITWDGKDDNHLWIAVYHDPNYKKP